MSAVGGSNAAGTKAPAAPADGSVIYNDAAAEWPRAMLANRE